MLLDLFNYLTADQRQTNDRGDSNRVYYGRTVSAALGIIVETPDVAHRFRPRGQLQRRELLGKKQIINILKERLPERLLRVLREKQIQFGLAGGAQIRFLGCHKVFDPSSFISILFSRRKQPPCFSRSEEH